ncbi:MAG TPA: enoyl-CoA hydratase-related protein [Thermoleophilaceae bacterium]|nr:enoyl-CoA hydratase-related protein [Thermoleophilaceae bacterium]
MSSDRPRPGRIGAGGEEASSVDEQSAAATPAEAAGDSPTELASGKLLLDEPSEGVARLRISNPARRGALDHELLDALAEAAGDLEARCLVITGSGKVFSAGYDLGGFGDEERFAEQAERLVAHPFHAAIEALERYPYPVLAAVNGHAIGGGLEMVLAADIRIAARGAKLGMPPAKIGLIYSHTGLRKFIEACGPAHTSELFHTGRNVDAERGEEIGLVNHVVDEEDLEQASLSMAGEIAGNAPLSLTGNKRIIRELLAHPGALPGTLERKLVNLRESCFRSEDFREGVRSFAEKRPPEWKGR